MDMSIISEPYVEERDPFLATLGRKIRTARERRGISRRVLSERCGLSQRFLAQVEHGRGNISILRLRRLAQALELPVEELLAAQTSGRREPEERRWPFSPAVVADLFRRAGTREQEAVLDLLVRGAGSGRAT